MTDVEAPVAYFSWEPDLPDGVYDVPGFGEMVPGRVIEATGYLIAQASNSPQFKKSTKSKFENQGTFVEERAARRVPHTGEEV